MHYKIKLKERFESKRTKLLKDGYKNINDWAETVLKNGYSQEDENFIINLKLTGVTDKEISSALNRSYWGVVDKIRRLKIESKL